MGLVRRRQFLVATGVLLAAPVRSLAQQAPGKIVRIGFLGLPTLSGWARMVEAFRAGLRQHGYVEGDNLVIEFRWAEGHYDRLPALASELVHLKPDVIVTHAAPGVRAAKEATTTIPIVIAASGDAVAAGLVASLARPGGNVTGSSFLGPVVAAKRLDILKEALPRIRRVALLYNPDLGGGMRSVEAVEQAAAARRLELLRVGVHGPDDFDAAFARMAGAGVHAVLINEDPMFLAEAKSIVNLATKRKLPIMGFARIAEVGGLMAFSASTVDMHRRAAYFVDRILRGAKPSDLPVEQPTSFELLINAKAAATLGVTVPQSILARADRVIE